MSEGDNSAETQANYTLKFACSYIKIVNRVSGFCQKDSGEIHGDSVIYSDPEDRCRSNIEVFKEERK